MARKANIVQDGDEDDLALTISLSVTHVDEWILDSGCSYHMCANRGWFSSFQEIDGGISLMRNDNTCKTPGISTI